MWLSSRGQSTTRHPGIGAVGNRYFNPNTDNAEATPPSANMIPKYQ